MVQECVHILADGRKCRRIPKRGQKLCPIHRPHRRRPTPWQQDQEFGRQTLAFLDKLQALNFEDLIETTGVALSDILEIVFRRSCRRDRLAFARAAHAVSVTLDRVYAIRAAHRASGNHHVHPVAPAAPATGSPALTPAQRTQLAQVDQYLAAAPPLSADQLSALCTQFLSILDSSTETPPTLLSNR